MQAPHHNPSPARRKVHGSPDFLDLPRKHHGYPPSRGPIIGAARNGKHGNLALPHHTSPARQKVRGPRVSQLYLGNTTNHHQAGIVLTGQRAAHNNRKESPIGIRVLSSLASYTSLPICRLPGVGTSPLFRFSCSGSGHSCVVFHTLRSGIRYMGHWLGAMV